MMREASFPSFPEDEAITRVGDLDGRPTRTWEGALFSRLMNDVQALPCFEATRPVSVAPLEEDPNVFEEPPLPSDPPPIWEVLPPAKMPPVSMRHEQRVESPSTAASWALPLLFAIAGAGTALVCLDASARAFVENAVGVVLAHVM